MGRNHRRSPNLQPLTLPTRNKTTIPINTKKNKQRHLSNLAKHFSPRKLHIRNTFRQQTKLENNNKPNKPPSRKLLRLQLFSNRPSKQHKQHSNKNINWKCKTNIPISRILSKLNRRRWPRNNNNSKH